MYCTFYQVDEPTGIHTGHIKATLHCPTELSPILHTYTQTQLCSQYNSMKSAMLQLKNKVDFAEFLTEFS